MPASRSPSLVVVALLGACARPITSPAAENMAAPVSGPAPTTLADVAPPDRAPPVDAASPSAHALDTVFLIVMENHAWSRIAKSHSAPFIDGTLLPEGAHAENYHHAPNAHNSEPNYIWLEAGSDRGLSTDHDATRYNSAPAGTPHLTSLLEAAGVSWTAYQEDAPDGVCPLRTHGRYAAKHDPFVFFRDVTDDEDPRSQYCMEHVVPMSRLGEDLAADRVGGYVFLTPDLCHDMHGAPGCPKDRIRAGDDWLAKVVPMLQASPVYQRGHAAILITWDEGSGGDQPIGMIAISPHARQGYASQVRMSHSSTLRSLEEIFEVSPLLGDAANANSLADLFAAYP